jgi:hypothetical protein
MRRKGLESHISLPLVGELSVRRTGSTSTQDYTRTLRLLVPDRSVYFLVALQAIQIWSTVQANTNALYENRRKGTHSSCTRALTSLTRTMQISLSPLRQPRSPCSSSLARQHGQILLRLLRCACPLLLNAQRRPSDILFFLFQLDCRFSSPTTVLLVRHIWSRPLSVIPVSVY